MADDVQIQISTGYPIGQLVRAITHAGKADDVAEYDRALRKIKRWQAVIAGMADGSIQTGSRTPVAAPAWVTLEVVTGGFVTGAFLAGGPLQEHERTLANRLNIAPTSPFSRLRLNLHYLSDPGAAELIDFYGSGRYRINVPEEAALMTVALLSAKGRWTEASELIDEILPFFDRLRFFPQPAERPIEFDSDRLCLQTVGQLNAALTRYAPPAQLMAQHETIGIWLPLYDELASLLFEIRDAAPDAAWFDRLRVYLDRYRSTRINYASSRRPLDRRSNFRLMLSAVLLLEARSFVVDQQFNALATTTLGRYEAKYGRPESPAHSALRAKQARQIAAPDYSAFAKLLSSRLKALDPDAGLNDPEPFLQPTTNMEGVSHFLPPGASIPRTFARKVQRARTGSLEQLVEWGLISSGDVIARLAPQIAGEVQAQIHPEKNLQRLYYALYRAFRLRRSLLLLNLQSQVRINELPWYRMLSSLAPDRDLASRDTASELAKETLRRLAAGTLKAFPYSIVPNKLLQEFRALAESAELQVPLVDELAADIFMGKFSRKFEEAAALAGELLAGSLYARYYSINYADLEWQPTEPRKTGLSAKIARFWGGRESAPAESESFADLCWQRAGLVRSNGWASVAANGAVIEQQQILTTQNLASLFVALDLRTELADHLPAMSVRCFQWICERLQPPVDHRHAALIRAKKCAYAWRQMLFFASVSPGDDDAFLKQMIRVFDSQPVQVRDRLKPAVNGLLSVANGRRLLENERIFLGWAATEHWLVDD